MSEPTQKPRHFAMLRAFSRADLLTIGNAACGTVSILLCLNYVAEGKDPWLWAAFVLLPVALILDLLDGWVARTQNRQSVLGADLDSLADIVSFGVAPAVLGFTLGLRGLWDAAILVYFVACGISRLARFNATTDELTDPSTGKVKYFEGTPIPSSLIIVAVLCVAFLTDATGASLWGGELRLGPGAFHPLTLIFALSGTAMISSTLRVPKP